MLSFPLASSLLSPRASRLAPSRPVSSWQMTRGRATLFAEGHVVAPGARGLPQKESALYYVGLKVFRSRRPANSSRL